MIDNLFDIELASNHGPLLLGFSLGLLELVHELNQIIVAGMAIDALLVRSCQAVSNPVGFVHIAIVTQAVPAKEGLVGLLD